MRRPIFLAFKWQIWQNFDHSGTLMWTIKDNLKKDQDYCFQLLGVQMPKLLFMQFHFKFVISRQIVFHFYVKTSLKWFSSFFKETIQASSSKCLEGQNFQFFFYFFNYLLLFLNISTNTIISVQATKVLW